MVVAAMAWLPVGGAWAKDITTLPQWDPMVMMWLHEEWVNPANHALGQFIQVENAPRGSTYAPATENLRQYGGLLTDYTYFQPTDQFAAPLNVLNGTSFGRSFGWTGESPAGSLWKIVQTAGSPGLTVYNPYATNFAAIYTGSGSAMTWDGFDLVNGATMNRTVDEMFHPVFAVPAQVGSAFVDYSIYAVDAGTGGVLSDEPGYVHLTFNAVPEPASLMLLLGGSLLAARIRRRPARA
jgi:hypothetical protein